MKKLGLIGAVLLVVAAPVWARVDIKITGEDGDSNTFTVNYRVVSEPNKVRAFALDIMVTSPAVIGGVSEYPVYPDSSLNKYWVYPGSIVILNGDVNDSGTPVANPYDPCVPGGTRPGLDSNGITIEMGSLYYPSNDSSPNSPAGVKTGSLWNQPGAGAWAKLLKFRVDKRPAVPVYVTIRENTVRGGVVLTNGAHPDVNVPTNWPLDCLIGGNASANEYKEWVTWGRPKCWCYSRQCRGDADGKKIGFWVALSDLTLLRSAISKADAALALVPNGICADFDHKKVGFRVALSDLTILRAYISKVDAQVPTCDKAPTITGPYNWWSN